MGFWDALLGRSRVPKPRTDALFALSTAWVTFQAELEWTPVGRAGLVLKSPEAPLFHQAEEETRALLDLAAEEMGSRIRTQRDEYGYTWLLVEDQQFEDLVALVHMAGTTLREKGFGEQLLAAVFRLEKPRENEASPAVLFLIYNYKRGAFYPFVPRTGAGKQERDHTTEMQIYALLEKELPWEKDLSRWFPLWSCPV